jgi:DNA-directed RNA polymerase subunit beta'
MTITTPGSLAIKASLPTQKSRDVYDLAQPLDKHGISNLINNLLENGGPEAHNTINTLTKKFFDTATEIGATTPLEAYTNESDERQATLKEFEFKVNQILASKQTKQEQAAALGKLAGEYQGRISKQNLQYMLGKGSVVAQMSNVGARATTGQLAQATYSPLMAADIKGNPIPVVVKHSFAEGLTTAEHLAMAYSGRASTVLAQLATQYPGALFKKLTPSVFHEVITVKDCGTKNGVQIPTSDKLASVGKFEAKTNKLVDLEYLKSKINDGQKFLLLRSSLTCEAKQGLCQMCYGLAANGRPPEIGTNPGIIAAQSISEVLTQAMLSVKHTGSGAGARRNAYESAANLLNNPRQNFQDEATLSTLNGKVTDIKKTALNDTNISVNGIQHFVDRHETPLVSVGQKVRLGDVLSTGVTNPRQLVDLKGAGAGRISLSNQLREVYSSGSGKGLDPRHFDVISRNMIKHVVVQDPGLSGLLVGDTVDIGSLNQHLAENSKEIAVDQALGKSLAKGSLELTPGTILGQNHLDYLKDEGVKLVSVSTDNLKVKPIVPGLQTNKLLDKNWVSKLAFNHLSKTIQEAAFFNHKSPIHSTEPITSYVMGNEFGDGTDGKY